MSRLTSWHSAAAVSAQSSLYAIPMVAQLFSCLCSELQMPRPYTHAARAPVLMSIESASSNTIPYLASLLMLCYAPPLSALQSHTFQQWSMDPNTRATVPAPRQQRSAPCRCRSACRTNELRKSCIVIITLCYC